MSYSVYEDSHAATFGVTRWAGYGVPAVCDMPGGDEEIHRGLAFMCESHVIWDASDTPLELPGCGFFFCKRHRADTDDHETVKPKPDGAGWTRHMLTDPSWEDWRSGNPTEAERLKARLGQDDGV